MLAKIKSKGPVTVVELDGHIDFETAKPFREKCTVIIEKAKASPKILFNMQGLKFVGSSGISSFIQTLKELNIHRPKFCGVGSEFKKLFKIYSPDETFEIFLNEDEAIKSFTEPK